MPKSPKKASAEAEVKYPKLAALWKVGDKALTFEEAKKYLGWREDTPEEKFTDFDLELPNGRRVIFENNTKNRIWRPLQLKVLKQDHLNRRFRFNPDGFGIGRTGQIISCQHRLRSFCEAELERQANPKKWGEEPLTMECVIVVGMDESDETFRILNLTSPATAADAFYRAGCFAKHTKANRAKLCTMMEQAIKCLWVRTGQNKDGYTPIQTNPEVADFHEKHGKIEDCCVHIFESYSSGQGHSSRMGAGSAAALMYLMGCSATDQKGVEKYRQKRVEKILDWSLFDKSHDFWTELVGGEAFACVRDILNDLTDEDEPLTGLYERKLVVVKAWNLYRAGEAITEDAVALKTVGEGEKKELDEHPDLGGIDMNEGKGQIESESGDPLVTPNDVEEEKAKIAADKQPEPQKGKKKEDDYDREEEKRRVTQLRVDHRGKVLLFATKKELIVIDEDADLFNRLFGLKVKNEDGMKFVGWPLKEKDELIQKLKAAKKKAMLVSNRGQTVEKAV